MKLPATSMLSKTEATGRVLLWEVMFDVCGLFPTNLILKLGFAMQMA